jgi:hypothetical protein
MFIYAAQYLNTVDPLAIEHPTPRYVRFTLCSTGFCSMVICFILEFNPLKQSIIFTLLKNYPLYLILEHSQTTHFFVETLKLTEKFY